MESTHLTKLMTGLIAVLVLDFKGDFGDIPNLLGRDRWLYLDPANGFRLPWNPPYKCRDYNGWINNLIKVICANCDLKFSEGVLAAVFRIAFNLLNNPITTPVNFPSPLLIEQLLDYLPRWMITTKGIYLESALHKIRFIRRVGENLFEAERGFDIFEHLIKAQKCAVINCPGLNPILRNLIVNIISLQFNFTSISLNETSSQTKFVLVVDEGDELASKEVSAKYPEGYSEYARGF
ncbi:MAG TPA: hypothetical protein ENH85_10420, partial [Candidatus Scalindua sp.]|nr:hypothetical protein [Candidatus Scalindua sp.]